MLDKFGIFARWYRQGRRQYGLTASAAFDYAQQRMVIFTSDLDYGYEPDDESGLLVWIVEDDTTLDALGGVDMPFSVSDHGNTHTDEADPFFVSIVAELMEVARV